MSVVRLASEVKEADRFIYTARFYNAESVESAWKYIHSVITWYGPAWSGPGLDILLNEVKEWLDETIFKDGNGPT